MISRRILAEISQKKMGEEAVSSRFFLAHQASLSREELAELIELSLDLKKA